MTLHINNPTVDKLLDEITQITGESRTEAVRKALEERRRRLSSQTPVAEKQRGLTAFLQEEVWPQIPPAHLGVRLTKEEQEDILGYGEHGA
jgi:antitoxin VapB